MLSHSTLDAQEEGFKVVTVEAYHIKVLAELLNNNLTEGNLVFGEDGITFREADEGERVLIDVNLRASDLQYDPPSKPIKIGIDCGQLYKTLHRIKKKDKLSIVKEANDNSLQFNILNADKERDKDASICIKGVKETEWAMPTYAKNPICSIPACEFQRMCKEMASLKTITVKVQKNGVRFQSGAAQLSTLSDKYGTWVENGEIIYHKTFEAKQFSRLSKCNGLAPNNHLKLFCSSEDEPLMLVSPIGTVGTFRACVSTEL
jgi:DNA polymerase III sliding clamp (beta) subunit (PCNA family)